MARIEPRDRVLADGRRVIIRVAEEADAAAVLAFSVVSILNSPHTVTEPDEAQRTLDEQAQSVREYLAGDGRLWLLAIDPTIRAEPACADGQVVGSLSFKNHPRRRMAHHGHFGIAVAPGWRGAGVGSRLIRALLEWAAASPVIDKVCLGVFESNAGARRLYERLGFAIEGVRRLEFKLGPGRYADDIQMAIYVKPGLAPQGFTTYVRRKES